MDVGSAAPLEAKSFTSLDGISFPASPTTGHALTLLNGWTSGRQFDTGNPAFWRKNGVVHLLGSLRAPSGFSSNEFAVLPPAARPAHFVWIPAYTNGGTFGWVTINPSGWISAVNFAGDAAARLYTSLATISCPASS